MQGDRDENCRSLPVKRTLSEDGKQTSEWEGGIQASLSGHSDKPAIILALVLLITFIRIVQFIDEKPKVGTPFLLTGD